MEKNNGLENLERLQNLIYILRTKDSEKEYITEAQGKEPAFVGTPGALGSSLYGGSGVATNSYRDRSMNMGTTSGDAADTADGNELGLSFFGNAFDVAKFFNVEGSANSDELNYIVSHDSLNLNEKNPDIEFTIDGYVQHMLRKHKNSGLNEKVLAKTYRQKIVERLPSAIKYLNAKHNIETDLDEVYGDLDKAMTEGVVGDRPLSKTINGAKKYISGGKNPDDKQGFKDYQNVRILIDSSEKHSHMSKVPGKKAVDKEENYDTLINNLWLTAKNSKRDPETKYYDEDFHHQKRLLQKAHDMAFNDPKDTKDEDFDVAGEKKIAQAEVKAPLISTPDELTPMERLKQEMAQNKAKIIANEEAKKAEAAKPVSKQPPQEDTSLESGIIANLPEEVREYSKQKLTSQDIRDFAKEFYGKDTITPEDTLTDGFKNDLLDFIKNKNIRSVTGTDNYTEALKKTLKGMSNQRPEDVDAYVEIMKNKGGDHLTDEDYENPYSWSDRLRQDVRHYRKMNQDFFTDPSKGRGLADVKEKVMIEMENGNYDFFNPIRKYGNDEVDDLIPYYDHDLGFKNSATQDQKPSLEHEVHLEAVKEQTDKNPALVDKQVQPQDKNVYSKESPNIAEQEDRITYDPDKRDYQKKFVMQFLKHYNDESIQNSDLSHHNRVKEAIKKVKEDPKNSSYTDDIGGEDIITKSVKAAIGQHAAVRDKGMVYQKKHTEAIGKLSEQYLGIKAPETVRQVGTSRLSKTDKATLAKTLPSSQPVEEPNIEQPIQPEQETTSQVSELPGVKPIANVETKEIPGTVPQPTAQEPAPVPIPVPVAKKVEKPKFIPVNDPMAESINNSLQEYFGDVVPFKKAEKVAPVVTPAPVPVSPEKQELEKLTAPLTGLIPGKNVVNKNATSFDTLVTPEAKNAIQQGIFNFGKFTGKVAQEGAKSAVNALQDFGKKFQEQQAIHKEKRRVKKMAQEYEAKHNQDVNTFKTLYNDAAKAYIDENTSDLHLEEARNTKRSNLTNLDQFTNGVKNKVVELRQKNPDKYPLKQSNDTYFKEHEAELHGLLYDHYKKGTQQFSDNISKVTFGENRLKELMKASEQSKISEQEKVALAMAVTAKASSDLAKEHSEIQKGIALSLKPVQEAEAVSSIFNSSMEDAKNFARGNFSTDVAANIRPNIEKLVHADPRIPAKNKQKHIDNIYKATHRTFISEYNDVNPVNIDALKLENPTIISTKPKEYNQYEQHYNDVVNHFKKSSKGRAIREALNSGFGAAMDTFTNKGRDVMYEGNPGLHENEVAGLKEHQMEHTLRKLEGVDLSDEDYKYIQNRISEADHKLYNREYNTRLFNKKGEVDPDAPIAKDKMPMPADGYWSDYEHERQELQDGMQKIKLLKQSALDFLGSAGGKAQELDRKYGISENVKKHVEDFKNHAIRHLSEAPSRLHNTTEPVQNSTIFTPYENTGSGTGGGSRGGSKGGSGGGNSFGGDSPDDFSGGLDITNLLSFAHAFLKDRKELERTGERAKSAFNELYRAGEKIVNPPNGHMSTLLNMGDIIHDHQTRSALGQNTEIHTAMARSIGNSLPGASTQVSPELYAPLLKNAEEFVGKLKDLPRELYMAYPKATAELRQKTHQQNLYVSNTNRGSSTSAVQKRLLFDEEQNKSIAKVLGLALYTHHQAKNFRDNVLYRDLTDQEKTERQNVKQEYDQLHSRKPVFEPKQRATVDQIFRLNDTQDGLEVQDKDGNYTALEYNDFTPVKAPSGNKIFRRAYGAEGKNQIVLQSELIADLKKGDVSAYEIHPKDDKYRTEGFNELDYEIKKRSWEKERDALNEKYPDIRYNPAKTDEEGNLKDSKLRILTPVGHAARVAMKEFNKANSKIGAGEQINNITDFSRKLVGGMLATGVKAVISPGASAGEVITNSVNLAGASGNFILDHFGKAIRATEGAVKHLTNFTTKPLLLDLESKSPIPKNQYLAIKDTAENPEVPKKEVTFRDFGEGRKIEIPGEQQWQDETSSSGESSPLSVSPTNSSVSTPRTLSRSGSLTSEPEQEQKQEQGENMLSSNGENVRVKNEDKYVIRGVNAKKPNSNTWSKNPTNDLTRQSGEVDEKPSNFDSARNKFGSPVRLVNPNPRSTISKEKESPNTHEANPIATSANRSLTTNSNEVEKQLKPIGNKKGLQPWGLGIERNSHNTGTPERVGKSIGSMLNDLDNQDPVRDEKISGLQDTLKRAVEVASAATARQEEMERNRQTPATSVTPVTPVPKKEPDSNTLTTNQPETDPFKGIHDRMDTLQQQMADFMAQQSKQSQTPTPVQNQEPLPTPAQAQAPLVTPTSDIPTPPAGPIPRGQYRQTTSLKDQINLGKLNLKGREVSAGRTSGTSLKRSSASAQVPSQAQQQTAITSPAQPSKPNYTHAYGGPGTLDLIKQGRKIIKSGKYAGGDVGYAKSGSFGKFTMGANQVDTHLAELNQMGSNVNNEQAAVRAYLRSFQVHHAKMGNYPTANDDGYKVGEVINSRNAAGQSRVGQPADPNLQNLRLGGTKTREMTNLEYLARTKVFDKIPASVKHTYSDANINKYNTYGGEGPDTPAVPMPRTRVTGKMPPLSGIGGNKNVGRPTPDEVKNIPIVSGERSKQPTMPQTMPFTSGSLESNLGTGFAAGQKFGPGEKMGVLPNGTSVKAPKRPFQAVRTQYRKDKEKVNEAN